MQIAQNFSTPAVPDIQNGLTATAAAGSAVTLTIPAPPAGQFHFIWVLQITKTAAALLTAGAVPVTVTTTNIPGTPSFDFDAAADAQGTSVPMTLQPVAPIKSILAATATTIVCPATPNVIWKVTALWGQAAN